LLNVGACPGLWRTYYAFKIHASGEGVGTEGIPAYLGRSLSAGDRVDLGTLFEGWVTEANHAANSFLAGGGTDWAHIDRIATPGLRTFYQARLTELLGASGGIESPKQFVLTSPARLRVFPDLPLQEATPDGVFSASNPGAVFESKLSDPGEENILLRSNLAAYALSAEHLYKQPFDFGIILHGNRPSDEIHVRSVRLSEADVERVRDNLVRLRDFVGASWQKWRERPHGKGAGSKPQTWEELLVRPRGPKPPARELGACTRCQFKVKCWEDGGW